MRESWCHSRLAVVTPSHQFPLGMVMSLQQRLALLSWAEQANAWILEDDYDSEYRYSGRPIEALQGLDSKGRVIYIGTFSKVMFPSLRLGYLVVPPQLVDIVTAQRQQFQRHVPILEQLALTDFIQEGHFARHIRHMRTLYKLRRDVLVEALRQELGTRLHVRVPEAGMHLVGQLPAHIQDVQVAEEAGKARSLADMKISSTPCQSVNSGVEAWDLHSSSVTPAFPKHASFAKEH